MPGALASEPFSTIIRDSETQSLIKRVEAIEVESGPTEYIRILGFAVREGWEKAFHSLVF